ncbi:MAG: hypothetical protein A2W38_03475 [Deltaproteobacteria bacterium RBG_19FT_COMBO_58_16]|nr:MAG: hypothetical protein A2W38_03475 [Deltaproteobacteria bacterium RBG_19FT_COMBO_58_16]
MMTSVYIDGMGLDFEDSDGNSTLGDLVGAIENDIKGIRRYVDGVCVDGEPLTGWRAPQGLRRPLVGLGEVKLQTASFDEVAADGVNTLREYTAVIKQNIEACASSLRRGGPAGPEFSSVVEGVIEVVKTIEMLARGGGAYGVALFSQDPAPCCSSLLDSLEALREAACTADSVSMADILEYELTGALAEVERITFFPAA